LQGLQAYVASILTDTAAYDTDAEHAAAVWDALLAGYNTDATMGALINDLPDDIRRANAFNRRP